MFRLMTWVWVSLAFIGVPWFLATLVKRAYRRHREKTQFLWTPEDQAMSDKLLKIDQLVNLHIMGFGPDGCRMVTPRFTADIQECGRVKWWLRDRFDVVAVTMIRNRSSGTRYYNAAVGQDGTTVVHAVKRQASEELAVALVALKAAGVDVREFENE